jgi:hypothetical protein
MRSTPALISSRLHATHASLALNCFCPANQSFPPLIKFLNSLPFFSRRLVSASLFSVCRPDYTYSIAIAPAIAMSREPKKTIDRKLNIASLPSPAGNTKKIKSSALP